VQLKLLSVTVIISSLVLKLHKCLNIWAAAHLNVSNKIPLHFREWKVLSSHEHCVSKNAPTWNGIIKLKIIKINFDDIWQKYSKYSKNRVCILQFHVGLQVITLSCLKLHTKNVCMFLLANRGWLWKEPVVCAVALNRINK